MLLFYLVQTPYARTSYGYSIVQHYIIFFSLFVLICFYGRALSLTSRLANATLVIDSRVSLFTRLVYVDTLILEPYNVPQPQ